MRPTVITVSSSASTSSSMPPTTNRRRSPASAVSSGGGARVEPGGVASDGVLPQFHRWAMENSAVALIILIAVILLAIFYAPQKMAWLTGRGDANDGQVAITAGDGAGGVDNSPTSMMTRALMTGGAGAIPSGTATANPQVNCACLNTCDVHHTSERAFPWCWVDPLLCPGAQRDIIPSSSSSSSSHLHHHAEKPAFWKRCSHDMQTAASVLDEPTLSLVLAATNQADIPRRRADKNPHIVQFGLSERDNRLIAESLHDALLQLQPALARWLESPQHARAHAALLEEDVLGWSLLVQVWSRVAEPALQTMLRSELTAAATHGNAGVSTRRFAMTPSQLQGLDRNALLAAVDMDGLAPSDVQLCLFHAYVTALYAAMEAPPAPEMLSIIALLLVGAAALSPIAVYAWRRRVWRAFAPGNIAAAVRAWWQTRVARASTKDKDQDRPEKEEAKQPRGVRGARREASTATVVEERKERAEHVVSAEPAVVEASAAVVQAVEQPSSGRSTPSAPSTPTPSRSRKQQGRKGAARSTTASPVVLATAASAAADAAAECAEAVVVAPVCVHVPLAAPAPAQVTGAAESDCDVVVAAVLAAAPVTQSVEEKVTPATVHEDEDVVVVAAAAATEVKATVELKETAATPIPSQDDVESEATPELPASIPAPAALEPVSVAEPASAAASPQEQHQPTVLAELPPVPCPRLPASIVVKLPRVAAIAATAAATQCDEPHRNRRHRRKAPPSERDAASAPTGDVPVVAVEAEQPRKDSNASEGLPGEAAVESAIATAQPPEITITPALPTHADQQQQPQQQQESVPPSPAVSLSSVATSAGDSSASATTPALPPSASPSASPLNATAPAFTVPMMAHGGDVPQYVPAQPMPMMQPGWVPGMMWRPDMVPAPGYPMWQDPSGMYYDPSSGEAAWMAPSPPWYPYDPMMLPPGWVLCAPPVLAPIPAMAPVPVPMAVPMPVQHVPPPSPPEPRASPPARTRRDSTSSTRSTPRPPPPPQWPPNSHGARQRRYAAIQRAMAAKLAAEEAALNEGAASCSGGEESPTTTETAAAAAE